MTREDFKDRRLSRFAGVAKGNRALSIYELTQTFPGEEKFGLVSQMRGAGVSIPSNIAEGQARRTTGDLSSSSLMQRGLTLS